MAAGTAANQQPPEGILLTSYCIEGRLVYSVRFERVSDDEPPALEIRLSPDPITRFLHDADTKFQAIAVSGCTILGLVLGSSDTVVLDIATRASAPGPPLRDPKRRPVMLPVGADTVIVMDTILLGGGCCCFEALRRVPGGGWRADPLPNPPIASRWLLKPEDDDSIGLLPAVGAYFVLGTRVWISINNRDLGTYSLDTQHGGTWREEGSWALPLRGRSLFVPELDLVFGFTGGTCLKRPRCHHLCALDVEARPPVVRHMWEFHVEREEDVPVGAGDAASLAHLGNGRFCIARPVNVERSAMLSPWCNGKGTCFALVDVTRSPHGGGGGELQLARRGRPHTHQWGWPYEHNGHVDFLI